jgi:putative transposase
MRELEAENAKLKRMYANLALENQAMKDVIEGKV